MFFLSKIICRLLKKISHNLSTAIVTLLLCIAVVTYVHLAQTIRFSINGFYTTRNEFKPNIDRNYQPQWNEGELEFYKRINTIHPTNFELVQKPWRVCAQKRGSNLEIFAYAFTHVESFEKRRFIRRTWGNTNRYPSLNVAFVVGKSLNETVNNLLIEENYKLGDIIQGDFLDTYRNLSYKSLAAWRWSMDNCDRAKLILKIDDDILMNTDNLLRYFRHTHPKPATFYGFVHRWLRVPRNTSLKVHVTVDEFFDDHFPTYCYGVAFLFTGDLLRKLYRAAFVTRDFWIDDVWATGILPSRLRRVKYVDLYNYTTSRDMRQYYLFYSTERERIERDRTLLLSCFFVLFEFSQNTLGEIEKVWNFISESKLKISV
jgi:beta-1,3-galactosyltransferase 1